MRISLNWLNDYVDIKNEDHRILADKITKAGINIEGIISSNISNLVVGYVEEKTSHPDSDHLNVCQVNIGSEILQIVCGASNVDKNQKVIVAKVGAVLPGDFEIKQANIRGTQSNGMICALYELGLEDKETNYHKGIHVLNNDAVVGSNPLTYLGLDDTAYELDLNPNRNDCLSHLGFAYEAAAVLGKKVTLPEVKTNPISEKINEMFNLRVNTSNCTMYKTRIVKDVIIGESPEFIKHRLTSAGMRPINNVVDISNYIMLEYGQPLHFFDKDKVGDEIVVRMANDQEHAMTLDNKDRTLISNDVVITNGQEVIAIAGVMGCSNSEIDTNTKNILIESAIFNPYNVRYTSLRLDLRSEASIRFEKGLNYEYTEEALNRACYLLEKYASGKVVDGMVSHDEVDKTPKVTVISRKKINDVLGMTLEHDDITNAFERLDFIVTSKDEDYTVVIPNRRMDVTIPEDLIEEVGRLYGYDNIIGKMPSGFIKQGSCDRKTNFRKLISKRMRTLGLNEVRTYTLVSSEDDKLFVPNNGEPISLQLPMSMDKSLIRRTILPSLLKVIDYNIARNVKDINIYEISNIYYKKDNEYVEETMLAFAMLGNYIFNAWQNNFLKVDFYVAKGIIENLLSYLRLDNRYTIRNLTEKINEIHPGISAEIIVDNDVVGYFGAIHPMVSKLPLFVGEISLDKLYAKKVGNINFKESSKFPSITKDVAFVIDNDITTADIIKVIKKSAGKLLDTIDVFDVYVGSNVGDGKKSIAFSLAFIDQNKTLTENEVNASLDNIIKEVESKLNGLLRDK